MECIISLINTSDAYIFPSFFDGVIRPISVEKLGTPVCRQTGRAARNRLDGTRILIGMRLDLMRVEDCEYVNRASSAVCTGFAVCAPTLRRISEHQTFYSTLLNSYCTAAMAGPERN